MSRHILLTCIIAATASLTAFAQDPAFRGEWRIESASVAPWWTEARPPDEAIVTKLRGRRIRFSPRAIEGPELLACAKPRYRVLTVPAEGLFQGLFGERNAAPLAAAAGFPTANTAWKTLDTGCEHDIRYHLAAPGTAKFALDNYIFTIRRDR